jgi:hypothetical protein
MNEVTPERLREQFGLRVFLSYARRDEVPSQIMSRILQTLEEEGWIKLWYDQNLTPAAKWDEEIKQKLIESDIIILLLSKNFINSNYCTTMELPLALKMSQKGETIIVPIVLEPLDLSAPTLQNLKQIQWLPRNNPIKKWENEWLAYENVLFHVRRIVIKTYAEKSRSHYFPGLSMRLMKKLFAVPVKSRSRAMILITVGTLLGMLVGRLVPIVNPGGLLTTFLSCLLSICTITAPLQSAQLTYIYLKRMYRNDGFRSEGLSDSLLMLVFVFALITISAIGGAAYGFLLATLLYLVMWFVSLKLTVSMAGWMAIGASLGLFLGYVAYYASQEKYIPGNVDDRWTPEPVDADLDATILN